MIPETPNQIHLSSKDRRTLAWSSKPERRYGHIPKYSTLPRADRRVFRCESCNKTFPNTELLKRHAEITHTGTKPIVCEICEKRFSTERHMLSHYHIHNEPRLQEFNVLTKRTKKVRSLPPSFTTTVGSFRGIPKVLKTYVSDPTTNSFGTKQSFVVTRNFLDDPKITHAHDDSKNFQYEEGIDVNVKGFMARTIQNKDHDTLDKRSPHTRSPRRVAFSATTREYSDRSSTSDIIRKVQDAQITPDSPTRGHNSRISYHDNVKKINVSPVKFPRVSSKRALVTKQSRKEMSKNTEINALSNNLETYLTETDSVNDDVISNVSRTPTPKSMKTRSSFTDAHRQLYSANSAFWDEPGYSKTGLTRRMSGVTSVSGYDPVAYREKSPKKPPFKSVQSRSDYFSDFT